MGTFSFAPLGSDTDSAQFYLIILFIACDELLFLPGTLHGEFHGIEGPRVVSEDGNNDVEEGDVAAGGGFNVSGSSEPAATPTATTTNTPLSSTSFSTPPSSIGRSLTAVQRHSIPEDESSVSSIQEFVNSWEDDADDGDFDATSERQPLNMPVDQPNDSSRPSRTAQPASPSVDHSMHALRSSDLQRHHSDDGEVVSAMGRFRQNHPKITRIGSFFFFRSSRTSTQNAVYAPSGPAVFGAALDLSMPILFNFHLFIEAFNHFGDSIASKTLPLIFLSVLIVRTCFPPKRRMRFWNTVSFIFMAPFQRSRFRDSYLGDVLTSLVRPCQDILFALSYYVTVIWGTVSGTYGLHTSGEMLQQSWILTNVILPSCALLPLWFKFLQTLRECYDSGKRWPHLGNAFKYFSASMVILYGMTHPEDRRSPLWLLSFALSLIYQIAWDTIMDWELFVLAPRLDESTDFEGCCLVGISSVRPTSRTLLALQRNVFQPIRDFVALAIRRIPSWRQIQLRPRRLYKTQAFYWRIFFLNSILRFTWMLCFIPAYHLSSRDNRHVTTFSSDTITYVGVLLPVAEIFRRTLWGFLYLEMKTLRIMRDDPNYSAVDMDDEEQHLHDVTELSIDSNDSSKPIPRGSYVPLWLRNQQQSQSEAIPSPPPSSKCVRWVTDEVRHKLFIAELALWAVLFVGFGLWATN